MRGDVGAVAVVLWGMLSRATARVVARRGDVASAMVVSSGQAPVGLGTQLDASETRRPSELICHRKEQWVTRDAVFCSRPCWLNVIALRAAVSIEVSALSLCAVDVSGTTSVFGPMTTGGTSTTCVLAASGALHERQSQPFSSVNQDCESVVCACASIVSSGAPTPLSARPPSNATDSNRPPFLQSTSERIKIETSSRRETHDAATTRAHRGVRRSSYPIIQQCSISPRVSGIAGHRRKGACAVIGRVTSRRLLHLDPGKGSHDPSRVRRTCAALYLREPSLRPDGHELALPLPRTAAPPLEQMYLFTTPCPLYPGVTREHRYHCPLWYFLVRIS